MLAAALTARGLDVFPPEGGYFLCANCHEPAMAFVERLADETGVVCTPLSVFYATPPAEDTWVRFTICKSAAHVDRACEALAPDAWLNKSSCLCRARFDVRRAHCSGRWRPTAHG